MRARLSSRTSELGSGLGATTAVDAIYEGALELEAG
jgi:hypothetical protein